MFSAETLATFVVGVVLGVGTVVAQSIVLFTIGLGAFLLLWSESPANG